MAERLQVHGYVREIDLETRRVTAVVTTGQLARDDAIIEPEGWRLDNYARNPVVLWAHDTTSLPIARTVETRRTPDGLIQVHEFADTEFASRVFSLVERGFVNATSVRWIPGRTEWREVTDEDGRRRKVLVFTEGHELLEVSYVPIPADPGALVVRADGSPADLAAMFPSEPCAPEPAAEYSVERLRGIADAIRKLSGRGAHV